jgi:predicted lipid-binding transport protein (Tim44 family)
MTRLFSGSALVAAFAVFMTVALTVPDADARRLGGGRSFGQQSRNVTQREAPAAPQSTPQRRGSEASQPSAPNGAIGAPQPQRNRWLGPVAGLAAGLGLAALMSHLGFGGAFGEMLSSLLLIGLLVVGVMFVLRLLRGGKAGSPAARNAPQPAWAGATGGGRDDGQLIDLGRAAREGSVARRDSAPAASVSAVPSSSSGGPVSVTGVPLRPVAGTSTGTGPTATPTEASTATWTLPEDFDVEGFLRHAKVNFVRMQAAWDAGDQADIREFTTPEMFAEVRMELADRGSAVNFTEVVELDAQLLGIEMRERDALASVRFTGTLREARDAAPEAFVEVWNLVKPLSGSTGWLLAGIQQAG